MSGSSITIGILILIVLNLLFVILMIARAHARDLDRFTASTERLLVMVALKDEALHDQHEELVWLRQRLDLESAPSVAAAPGRPPSNVDLVLAERRRLNL